MVKLSQIPKQLLEASAMGAYIFLNCKNCTQQITEKFFGSPETASDRNLRKKTHRQSLPWQIFPYPDWEIK